MSINDDSSLEGSFLSLFSLANDKDPWAVEVWEQGGEGTWWSPCLLRHLHDYEIEGVITFLKTL